MNKRTIKKVATRYLDTGILRARYHIEETPDGNGGFIVEISPESGKIYRAIRAAAYRRGWNGHWADSPLIVAAEDGDEIVITGYAFK